MRSMQHELGPTDDDIAAALAAVRCYVEQQVLADLAEHNESVVPFPRPWNAAAALAAQGMPPTRGGAHRTWGAAERAARAGRWSYGIVGI
jgi:hypothetical protein